ncbi:S-adenosyl-L-methionine-dependent methyltransferase [Emericellopsis atlantica]|uniref:Protein arginine methyltransferase NDUFAF7 n=1 Tax=Emericellopsis atlantica TaxID=2614577 RepID=A0A9P8CRY2_9HYPO|nr:S-adenosyl-L-methionine-dependent methyltransferase [Emericellopsis atlantica]KAG9255196.1 S-adenosyl-L-methionine-dependent methyltransferase [Emericellopsis atlantica]
MSRLQSIRRQEERQWSTPLAKQLFEAISLTGPVPLSSYMRMCLTGDLGGYYTGAIAEGRDQFGAKGDFVTSPEISQIFGELIGIWFIAEWINQGRPKSGVQIIEVGPGRGTLMDDMLRTIQRFPAMAASVESVYMVEASKELREAQKTLLCGPDAASSKTDAGFESKSKYDGKKIEWSDSIKALPVNPNKTPFILAHEFFDALPIHIFESAMSTKPPPGPSTSSAAASSEKKHEPTPEWREMLVSPTPPGTTHQDLKTPKLEQGEPVPEFQLIMSSAPTRHSRYVPESSPRYRALKDTPGSVIEVCPDASLYATDFAHRIGGAPAAPKAQPSGAALILDYGTSDTIPVNSLRGIRHHKRVNPFSAPGLVDLSADVDFLAIAEAAMQASEGVEVHGPIRQGDFLELMGIRQRAEILSKGVGEEARANIDKAWKRLVDRGPGGMGKVYKALAILPENDGQRRPVGFGGDVRDKVTADA